jgi:hypothetical protein
VTFVRLALSAWSFVALVALTVGSSSLAGCGYEDPSYGGVSFACDAFHACPAGYLCISGRCLPSGGSGSDETPPPAKIGVDCGGATCSGANLCCNYFGGGDGVLACEPSNVCTLGNGRGVVACDGPEDCPNGSVCCTDGIAAAKCEPGNSCDVDDQLCNSSFDCPLAAPFCRRSDLPARPFKVCDPSPS